MTARQHAGELQADLLLLVRRKHRDDAVDRLGGVERVQRREARGGRSRPRAGRFQSVSKSRISPTRMTSGSWRRALRSACANERVSTATSRWLTIDLLIAVQELDRVLDRHDVRPTASC